MPTTPINSKCRELGCNHRRLWPSTLCVVHGGRTEAARANLKFYKSKAWQDRRAIELSRQPLCVACLAQGRVRMGGSIDHIFPHWRDEKRFLRNLFQNLCAACHHQKTREEMQGRFHDYARGAVYCEADYAQKIGSACE